MTDAARSIARSLFRRARELGELEPVTSDLAQLARIASSPDVRRFLAHPRIPLADKEKVLAQSVSNGLVRRLLDAMLVSHSTGLLPDVNEGFAQLVRREAGFVEAVARVPQPLSPAQEAELSAAVKASTGLTPVLRVRVDPQLIGGVRLVIDGQVADNSLESGLKRLKEKLQAL